MAERRMFAKTIVLSDAFLDMPIGARCLYMTMGMLADDDGFVNAPKSIMRQCGASNDDLQILFAKKFLIPFDSGVIVIKHWRINNYLQKDRVQPTKYQDEFRTLSIESNGAYTVEKIPETEQVKQLPEVKETTQKYGEYGWIKLTAKQAEKLMKDLGKEEFERCVQVVDEYVQGNGNKNKYRDWNLVIRKCHREGWGNRKPVSAHAQAGTGKYDFLPDY